MMFRVDDQFYNNLFIVVTKKISNQRQRYTYSHNYVSIKYELPKNIKKNNFILNLLR